MNGTTSKSPDLKGYLPSVLVLFAWGSLVLVVSLVSYWHFTDVQGALREHAEEEGIGEIPGVNFDGEVRWALAFVAVGGIMMVAAVVLTFIAMTRKRG